MTDLLENVAFQAAACRVAGSPLYERLLDVIGDDIRAGGMCATILATDKHPEPLASALPLRFMGALHRIVLAGSRSGSCCPLPVGWRRRHDRPHRRSARRHP